MPLKERVNYNMAIQVYKCINGLSSQGLDNIFTHCNEIHSHITTIIYPIISIAGLCRSNVIMFLYTTYVCIYVCLLYVQHECTNIIIKLMYVHINTV